MVVLSETSVKNSNPEGSPVIIQQIKKTRTEASSEQLIICERLLLVPVSIRKMLGRTNLPLESGFNAEDLLSGYITAVPGQCQAQLTLGIIRLSWTKPGINM